MARDCVIGRAEAILRSHAGITFHHDPAPNAPSAGKFLDTDSLPLHPELLATIKRQFPDGLFRHQSTAIRKVLAGQNTVVATQTSSGKSLIYSIPALEAVLTDSEATALFIYPQKALANDQLEKLHSFVRELPGLSQKAGKRRYFISRYDGSTEASVRAEVRNQVQIALTNPDMLHMGILQYHERHWARFFANLSSSFALFGQEGIAYSDWLDAR